MQPSEVVDLVVALILAPIIIVSVIRARLPYRTLVFTALGAMLVSYTTTILEGFVLPDVMNLLEHLGLAVAGVCFALAIYRLRGLREDGRAGGRS